MYTEDLGCGVRIALACHMITSELSVQRTRRALRAISRDICAYHATWLITTCMARIPFGSARRKEQRNVPCFIDEHFAIA